MFRFGSLKTFLLIIFSPFIFLYYFIFFALFSQMIFSGQLGLTIKGLCFLILFTGLVIFLHGLGNYILWYFLAAVYALLVFVGIFAQSKV